MSTEELKKNWTEKVKTKLLGRKIIEIRFMTPEEIKFLDWANAAVVIKLDDGLLLYPSCDDELNNAGSLATTCNSLPLIPVI